VLKFGRAFARKLRRLRPRASDLWHLDEMVVLIQGRHILWRAVDSEGEVLDLLRLMRKLLKSRATLRACS
jgi:putative transposase